MALDVLFSFKKFTLTEENNITINDYLEDPDFKSVEEIALYCGITQKLVIDYVETKQLSGIYSKESIT